MLRIYFLTIILLGTLLAQECYQHFTYHDSHQVQTRFDSKVIDENTTLSASLHTRHLEDNGSFYTIVWFEEGIQDKSKIDIESIYAPFMLKHSPKGFIIEKLYSLSKDKKLHQQLLAIVDSMQFKDSVGIHRFKNGGGVVEVNQSKTKEGYSVAWVRQLNDADISYKDVLIDISLDHNCSIWKRVTLRQTTKLQGFIPNSYLVDQRSLTVTQSDFRFPKEHWFLHLDNNISSWGMGSKESTLSLKEALAQFESKHKEMMALLHDRKAFLRWMQANMEFLAHLDQMLESMQLDNDISMNLFAKLGYLDTVLSSRILSKVTLNEEIDANERFRALMGLKNTSAPLDDELLESLLDYGLNANNGEDMLKNATGMLMGALAKERTKRAPHQVERINEALLNVLNTQEDKRVVMAAIGNMGEGASEEIIKAVDDVVTTSDDYKSRKASAQAIEKLNRTELDSQSFESLILKEDNSDTKAQLIKASVATKDLKNNTTLKNEFLHLADDANTIQSNRMASLITLDKSGYGNTPKEKATIRKMMMGEKDPHVMKMLKKIYRK
ncbi:MAG: hypothetical protein U9N49_01270 [Campylobacterota bacterium]|nr:hypothetical protein [Campylobacterota bacterium]